MDASLVGESSETESNDKEAKAYRQQIIKHMFPGTNIPSLQDAAETNAAAISGG